jgi:biopolymer transport protein ExbD
MSEKRRQLKRPHNEEIGLQIAPMVDVTMLLLFFFMLTGKLMQGQKVRSIHLPKASAGVIPKDVSGRDVVNIDEQGRILVGDQVMSSREFRSYLKQRLAEYPPLKVYVRADARTKGSQIKEVMRAAAEAGAIEVIYGSYQR